MLPEPPSPDLHQAIRALLLAARAQVRQTVNTALAQTQGGKEKGHISKLDAKDFFRDPYVLAFLGVPAVPALYEKDLEQGLLDQLQTFLLELGKGFVASLLAMTVSSNAPQSTPPTQTSPRCLCQTRFSVWRRIGWCVCLSGLVSHWP